MLRKIKERIIKFFCSIPLVIVLLGLIIIGSALGSCIPQGLPLAEYSAKYGIARAQLFFLLGLNDVYHAPWFIALLSLLWLSLFTCTLRQLKSWRKSFRSIITHLGLLVILLGALVTGAFGEKGFLMVYEGHSQDVFLGADNKFRNLDFKIYLDDFEIEWYDSASDNKRESRIKDFKSKIVVIDNGKAVAAKIVRVNHPLTYKGFTFLQSSYDKKEYRWTGLEVVRDPGAPFVYSGFFLLNIGIILIFYFRPKRNISEDVVYEEANQ